jgi:hypothetical protein
MIRDLNAAALFDSLYLGAKLDALMPSFGRAELHTFGYLSCLLWLFKKEPISMWGYEFVGIEAGAPFSWELELAIEKHLSSGRFIRDGRRFRVNEDSSNILHEVSAFEFHRYRIPCLEAAIAPTSGLSIGMITSAITSDPELRRWKRNRSSRHLLEARSFDEFYRYFDAIIAKLGISEGGDLKAPAFVWISALLEMKVREEGEPA